MNTQPQPSRPTAQLIYERVREDARDELDRPAWSLTFSGLFAGFTIGATPLAAALALALLGGGGGDHFVAALVYPVGFLAVILGRAQFFTENTLYPVVVVLEDRRAVVATARLWAVVLGANLIGGLGFALVAVESSALSDSVVGELTALGDSAASGAFWKTFWKGVLAGWLLALVAWLVEASETAVGQVFVIWFLTMLVGLGSLDHSVATAVEVMGSTLDGSVGLGEALGWLATTVAGNIVGGVMIVTLLNYGQVRAEASGGGGGSPERR